MTVFREKGFEIFEYLFIYFFFFHLFYICLAKFSRNFKKSLSSPNLNFCIFQSTNTKKSVQLSQCCEKFEGNLQLFMCMGIKKYFLLSLLMVPLNTSVTKPSLSVSSNMLVNRCFFSVFNDVLVC